MAGGGWISFAIMALAAVLANTLTYIAASNTNIPYIKNTLGAFIPFVGVQPPIPTADENILLELYLLSRVGMDASSARFSQAGVHHPPPVSSASAGGLNFLLVLYYLALAVLILYPLSYPFVRIVVRKRAKAKANSEGRDVARLLRKEKGATDGLTRENNELKQVFGQLQRNDNQPEEENTWNPGSAKTVRNLIKENDSLRATLRSKENQTQATETQLSEVEQSESNLKTELSKTKSALVKAETLNHKSEDDRNKEFAGLKIELQEAKNRSQDAENSKTTAVEILSNENTELKTELELASTKLQRAEESKSELGKNLTQADTGIKELETLTKENIDLKAKLERAKTKLQQAEKSKSELEKNLAQADTDLKELDPLTKENIDLKRKLEGATIKLQWAEKSKSELEKNLAQADTDLKELDPLTKENIDLKRKLEGATTKLQRAEKSKTELEKNLTQANTDLDLDLETLTKENIDLKRKLEGATTKLQRAEKSKTELEKTLTQANTDLDLDLETLTKENNDLKTKLEWSTDTLHLAEKSKSELKKNLNQANDGLREQLRKAKVMLKETEESKAAELDLRAKENVDLRNELQKLKNVREQQEPDDAKRWKAVDILAKEKTDLENELQQAGTILQEAEISKSGSESESSLNKANTDLKTELQKARAMLKEEEESKASAVDDMAKTNADLTNQSRRSEEEHNPRKTGLQSEPQGMEGGVKQASNDVEAEIKNPKEKLADQDEQKKDPKVWDEGRDKQKRYNEDATKRSEEARPNQDDQELQGTIDATTEPHTGPCHDALALTPDASLSSCNVGPETSPVALTPAKSEHINPKISLQTLPANIQSAPPTPNNRADIPPSVGKLDSLDTKISLPTTLKPIASRDSLGLSMAKSSHASRDNTSKAPPIRNSTGSSVDPKKINEEEADKERLRRSSYDTHSKLSPASSIGSVPNTNGETRSRTVAEPFLEGLNLNNLGQTGGYREDYRIPPGRIKRNRGNTSYKPNKTQPDTATLSQPQRTRSWSKDERSSSVLKNDPRKHSPNKSGKVEFNALNNPTIQTSYFSRVPTAPEHTLKVEHITFMQTLSKQGLKIDEITAKTSEAFPLLYQNCGLMGARPTESSRESLISTAVGLHTMSYAKWYV